MGIVLRGGVKDIEEPFARVAHFKHTGEVPAAVAIVGGTPDGTETVIIEHLVSLLAQLMSAQDVGHAVDLEELADDLRAKGIPSAAGGEGELVALGVRVGPDEVGHGALVGDFAEAVDDLDLVDGVDGGGEAAVDAEDLVVDDDAEGQEVEHVGEVVPHVGVAVFARTLGVEPVGLGHAAGLVISADEMHALWVSQLEADEEGDGFDAEETPVYVVACSRVIALALAHTVRATQGWGNVPRNK